MLCVWVSLSYIMKMYHTECRKSPGRVSDLFKKHFLLDLGCELVVEYLPHVHLGLIPRISFFLSHEITRQQQVLLYQ